MATKDLHFVVHIILFLESDDDVGKPKLRFHVNKNYNTWSDAKNDNKGDSGIWKQKTKWH